MFCPSFGRCYNSYMMRKTAQSIILLFAAFVFVFAFAACGPEDGPNAYSVRYIASEGGRIEGETEQTVEAGGSTSSVTAVPDDGYEFAGWSDGGTDLSRRDDNIFSDLEVTAYFEKSPDVFSVIYRASGGGRISGQTEQKVAAGGSASSVLAVPDDGYVFAGWSDGKSEAERLDENITGDIDVTALFAKGVLTVSYSAGVGGTIKGSAEQSVPSGGSASAVTAVPDVGYRFVRWSDTLSEDPVRRDTDITNDINATAEFATVLPGGSGTSENPVIISDRADLEKMSEYPGLYYALSADIDMRGEAHEPLFGADAPFDGVLDGRGYTISGMTVSSSSVPSLLGYVGHGTVRDLDISDFSIMLSAQSSGACVGAVAGVSRGVLTGITARGTITIDGGADGVCAGGLAGCVAADENIAGIYSCSADITLTSEAENALCGGLAATAVSDGAALEITDCSVRGSLDCADSAGGFICEINAGDAGVTVGDCSADIAVTSSAAAAGFAVTAAGDTLAMNNCGATGELSAPIGGGFCFETRLARLFRCHGAVTIRSSALGAGFVQTMRGGSAEECFASGVTSSEFQAAAFIGVVDGASVYNCYSQCDVLITNTDPDASVRTLASGFVLSARDSSVRNCYSAGTVAGSVYTSAAGQEAVVGGFAGSLTGTSVVECHCLLPADSFALKAVAVNNTPGSAPDVSLYRAAADMSGLADILNAALSAPVWATGENGLPVFVRN